MDPMDHAKPIGPCPCGQNIATLMDGLTSCIPDADSARYYVEKEAQRATKRASAASRLLGSGPTKVKIQRDC